MNIHVTHTWTPKRKNSQGASGKVDLNFCRGLGTEKDAEMVNVSHPLWNCWVRTLCVEGKLKEFQGGWPEAFMLLNHWLITRKAFLFRVRKCVVGEVWSSGRGVKPSRAQQGIISYSTECSHSRTSAPISSELPCFLTKQCESCVGSCMNSREVALQWWSLCLPLGRAGGLGWRGHGHDSECFPRHNTDTKPSLTALCPGHSSWLFAVRDSEGWSIIPSHHPNPPNNEDPDSHQQL